MTLVARLAKAESSLADDLLWFESQKWARRLGEDPSTIFEEARAVRANYGHLLLPGPDGKVDLDPALRAIAKEEGLDYDDLVRLMKHQVRQPRRVKER